MDPTQIRFLCRLGSRVLAAGAVAFGLAGCGGGGGGSLPSFDMFSAVAVADIDGDGLPDVVAAVTHLAGAPPHPGFVAIYLQLPGRPGKFAAPTTIDVGNDPVAIAVGDLDGDGRPDIVTANSILATSGAGVSDVSVLRQSPISPGRFLPAASYRVGQVPHDVAIADLDADGRPDLAVADSEGLSLLLQDAAVAGTFRPRVHIDAGGGTTSVAVGDLDGDGRPDLLATDALRVLVLYGTPGAGPAYAPPLRLGAGAQPIDVAAADLDGDGRPDLAVANLGSPSDPASASVSVLLQQAASRGSFGAATLYATALRSSVVAVADLDGDGRADIAVANAGALGGACPPDCGSVGTGISVLLQDPHSAGRYRAAQDYPAVDDFAQWVAIADVDGDGRPDLVIAQANGIYLRLQDPARPGQFGAAMPVSR